jgi:pilus assembly protein CpaE
MVADKIRVVIVDDIPETREHLTRLLGFEDDIEVVGSGGSGAEALDLAAQKSPDVMLLDINMPGMDGIATAEQLAIRAPGTAIIMMSVQGEHDYLRRAMLAGAREFLVKPFSSDELSASIRQVHSREAQKVGRVAAVTQAAKAASGADDRPPAGRVVTLFSPKGGVGRTTVAVNLAVAAATELGQRVCLIDGSLQFGDIGVLLNLSPKNNSIADVAREMAGDESEALESMLMAHSSGVRALLAPPTPEMAELVTAEHLLRIIAAVRATHDLVVIDAWPWLHDSTLAFLDQSDLILVVMTLEITSIKNARQFLGVIDQLGYPPAKIKLLLNRADSGYGIRMQDVESSLGRKFDHTIASDWRTVIYALNRGVPFVTGAKQARVSEDVVALARAVSGTKTTDETRAPAARKGVFSWRSQGKATASRQGG